MTDLSFDPNAGQNTGPLYAAVGEFPAGRFSRVFTPAEVDDLGQKWATLSAVDRALLGEKAAGAPDSDLAGIVAELRGAAGTEVVGAATPGPRLTVAQVKADVGDDVDRARTALLSEQADPDPRSTLLAWLEQVIADATVSPEPSVSLGSVHDTLGIDGDAAL